MVQVSGRFSDGSIKYCQVHDVLRDLAVQKAKEINFLMVCSKPDDWESCSKARRVAIHYSDVKEPIGNYASSNARSLLFFGDSSKLDCSKYRVLRVLAYMEGEVELQSFKGSPHLRYLQLKTNIGDKERDFGEWVRGMQYLETLDLRSSPHGDLSNWIWQVKTLRHVLLSHFTAGTTQGPLGASVDLPNLQTLRDVRYGELWKTSELPNIPDVRELGIQISGEIPEMEVVTLLNKLKNIVYLKMQRDIIDLPKIDRGGFRFYNNLKSLVLINYYHGHSNNTLVLGDDMFPPHLTELRLYGYEFGSDPMPVLENLGSLNTLWIRGMVEKRINSLRIKCSTAGFKQLEELVLHSLMLEEWKIEKGAMPMLKRLSVTNCPQVRVPPELIHLDSLQCLNWSGDGATRDILKQQPHLRPWYWDDFVDLLFCLPKF